MSEVENQHTGSQRARTRASAKRDSVGERSEKQTPTKKLKVLKRKPIKKNKFSDRKYFNVEEDFTILRYWSSNFEELSTREISDNLSEKIEHSSESIRDRIKRYISKLKKVDRDLLEEESNKNPTYYAHFMNDKSRNKKVITHFSAQQPRIAGSTLTHSEKRAIMKELRKKKREKISSGKNTPKKPKTVVSVPVDLEEIQEKSKRYKTRLRKRTPPKTIYDPFKEIEDLLKPQKTKKISTGSNLKLNTRKKETKPHKNLQEKVGIFLEQLDSKEDKDIECNAEILAEIIKSFAVTFSLEISDIVQIIEESGGPLNMEEIRSKLMERAK